MPIVPIQAYDSSSKESINHNHNHNHKKSNMCLACSKTKSSLNNSLHSTISSSDLEESSSKHPCENSSNCNSNCNSNCTNIITPLKKKSSRMKKKVRFAPPASTPDSSSSSNSNQRPATAAATARYSVQTDVIEEIKPASSMTDSERSSSYWQLKDYEYFRGTAQIIASEVLKVTASQPPSSHSYNAVLTRAYDLCAVLSESSYSPSSSSSPSSIDKREEKDDAAVAAAARIIDENNDQTVLPPHLFAALTHWVKAGHSRRGLEKFCVTSHTRTRPMAKSAIVQAVLLTQDLLRQQQSKKMASSLSPSTAKRNNQQQQQQPTKFHIGTSEFPLENLPQDEILRLVSERFSKTSRYFGTAMGQADAAAVGNHQLPIQK